MFCSRWKLLLEYLFLYPVLTVAIAIPIIMGANVGTCVPNTIVSFAEIGNKNEFRRAFAGAMVHDIFKWITMLVLFTVEIFCRKFFLRIHHDGISSTSWLVVKILYLVSDIWSG